MILNIIVIPRKEISNHLSGLTRIWPRTLTAKCTLKCDKRLLHEIRRHLYLLGMQQTNSGDGDGARIRNILRALYRTHRLISSRCILYMKVHLMFKAGQIAYVMIGSLGLPPARKVPYTPLGIPRLSYRLSERLTWGMST